MLTREALARFAPRPAKGVAAQNWDGYIDALLSPEITQAFAAHGLVGTQRMRHWLAQCAHESGGFTILWEDMNYRVERISEIFGVGKHSARVTRAEACALAHNPEALAERVYGIADPKCCGHVNGCTKLKTVKTCKARELGNFDAGDGYRCRGFGIMQTTGRRDHDRLLGGVYSFVAALLAAIKEWAAKGCNELADADDLPAITRKVNGGTNGLQDRQRYFAKATGVWPDQELEQLADAGIATLRKGMEGASVVRLQELLKSKNYFPGRVDGVYGQWTEDAVVLFQRHHRLDVDGNAGPLTFDALEKAPPRPEREATVATMVASGEETVTFTQRVKRWIKWGSSLLTGAAVEQQTGLGLVDGAIGQAEKAKQLAVRGVRLIEWVPSQTMIVIAVAVLVLGGLYLLMHRLEQRHLANARKGQNLGG